MKRFIIPLLLLFGAISASAQGFYAVGSSYLLNNAFIVGGATSNYTTVVDARTVENIPLELVHRGAATNVLNLTITMRPSIDGQNVMAQPTFSWVLAQNGTNYLRHGTNLPALGYGYWHLVSIANGNADTVLTNLTMRYAIKRLP